MAAGPHRKRGKSATEVRGKNTLRLLPSCMPSCQPILLMTRSTTGVSPTSKGPLSVEHGSFAVESTATALPLQQRRKTPWAQTGSPKNIVIILSPMLVPLILVKGAEVQGSW